MANWRTVLDIKDEWKKAGSGELSIFELAKVISDKLTDNKEVYRQTIGFSPDYELEDLIDRFYGYSEEKNTDADEFDDIMDRLYDWGDANHNCWIKTF